MRRLVAVKLAALGAFVNDDISLFRVGNHLDGLHWSAAFASSVAGIYVHV